MVSLIKTNVFINKEVPLNVRKEVTNYLSEFIKSKEIYDLESLEALKIIGAAIEKSNSYSVALEFYRKAAEKVKYLPESEVRYFRGRELKVMSKIGKSRIEQEEKEEKVFQRDTHFQSDKARIYQLDLENIPEYPEFEFNELENFVRIGKIGKNVRDMTVKNIKTIDLTLNITDKVRRITESFKLKGEKHNTNIRYFVDKSRFVIDNPEDSVSFVLKENRCENAEWLKISENEWSNPDWPFKVRLQTNYVVFVSEKSGNPLIQFKVIPQQKI